ncbi:MAG: hypothetical protein ABIA63_04150 [bacterium]
MKKTLYYLSPLIILFLFLSFNKIRELFLSDIYKLNRIIKHTVECMENRKAMSVTRYVALGFKDMPSALDKAGADQLFRYLFNKQKEFEFSCTLEYLTLRNDSAAAAFNVTFNDLQGNSIFNWTSLYKSARICILFIKEGGKWVIWRTDLTDFLQ